ncbi:MAG: hypothetical protein EP343_12055 [Deltaproteobacteria bacterium]|nr:MAG: hypothetical protein EP343_12055 [Deltaproteobacteria bacterium]
MSEERTHTAGAASFVQQVEEQTLGPAREKAAALVAEAQEQADKIVAEAKAKAASITNDAEAMEASARQRIEAEATQARRDTLDQVTAAIENDLQAQLNTMVAQTLADPNVLSSVVSSLASQKLDGQSLSVTVSDEGAKALWGDALQKALSHNVTVHVDGRLKATVILSLAEGKAQISLNQAELTEAIADAISQPLGTED